jgi:hypothetical protein
MPTFLRPTLLLWVLAATLVACAQAPLLPDQSGPLVTVTTRGGECFEGPCGGVIAIARNGLVHQLEPTPADLGELPPELLTALDAVIKTTDFAAIRANAFAGECPVNFDGQEVIYEFGAPGGVERIASCETEVDPDHPLFAAVTAALVAVDVVPAGG